MPARKPAARSRQSSAKKATQGRPKTNSTAKARTDAKVVGKMMTSVTGGVHDEAALFSELAHLAKYIRDAKKEIATLRPEEVKESFLPRASNDLEAIIGATADATHAIMDAAEIIEMEMAGQQGAHADKVVRATTAIYEACSFQDISGQRVTRVVKTLQEIEQKIDDLLVAFDAGAETLKKTTTENAASLNQEAIDEELRHGPQDPGTAKSQAEIDALLASLDTE